MKNMKDLRYISLEHSKTNTITLTRANPNVKTYNFGYGVPVFDQYHTR